MIFVVIVFIACVAFLAWLFAGTGVNRTSAEDAADPAGVPHDEQRTILIVGVDGDGSSVAGQRSDSIMFAREIDGVVDMISFPRDLLVDMPACTGRGGSGSSGTSDGDGSSDSEEKLNHVFAYASEDGDVDKGVDCLSGTIEEMAGVEVDEHIVLNMNNVETIVDELGGIELCLTEEEAQRGLVPGAASVGCQRVNGTQALAYARARTNAGDGSDLSRINRQHVVLGAMLKEVGEGTSIDQLPTLFSVTRSILDMSETSLNFSDSRELVRLARALRDAGSDSIVTIPVVSAADGVNLRLSKDSEPYLEALRTGAPLPASR
ncbi:LCP family protein [uncultured Corynebacterium sp.]|uniref:LCP family protein n=1 Tax=uncultured Corynebacterium sp. TaxID=159447 RepID=UPI0025FF548E|nr:LCP family protein [uncultured Corynebacterium sp.]